MKIPIIKISCLLLATALTACEGKRPTWTSEPGASSAAVAAALAGDPYYPYFWDSHQEDTPTFAPPEHLRPCCVFGVDLKTQLVNFPVPMVRVANITHLRGLGPHVYDAGFRGRGSDDEVKSAEGNGLIYTCRGGFVDIAHIRDNADWTIFLSSWVYRHLGEDAQLLLKPELGERKVMLRAFPIKGLGKVEQLIVATSIAQYLAWQISVWHEIAQWHGYAVFDIFPEYPSAYSVEDFYSNMLGNHIAAALIYAGAAGSDKSYARHMDVWIQRTLEALQAQTRSDSRRLTKALDQIWWDSTLRLPEKWVVHKRNYDNSTTQYPPIFPEELRATSDDATLRAICQDSEPPLPLHIRDEILGVKLPDLARLQIHLSSSAMPTFHFAAQSEGRRIVDQDDFDEIISADQRVDSEEYRALRAAQEKSAGQDLLQDAKHWLENLARPAAPGEPANTEEEGEIDDYAQ